MNPAVHLCNQFRGSATQSVPRSSWPIKPAVSLPHQTRKFSCPISPALRLSYQIRGPAVQAIPRSSCPKSPAVQPSSEYRGPAVQSVPRSSRTIIIPAVQLPNQSRQFKISNGMSISMSFSVSISGSVMILMFMSASISVSVPMIASCVLGVYISGVLNPVIVSLGLGAVAPTQSTDLEQEHRRGKPYFTIESLGQAIDSEKKRSCVMGFYNDSQNI